MSDQTAAAPAETGAARPQDDQRIADDLTTIAMDPFYVRAGYTEWAGGQEYLILHEEEARELGYPDDGPLLMRGNDGSLIEVDVEVTIRRVRPGPPPLPAGDWVLWSPCGCPRGVSVAQGRGGEDITWRRFYDSAREITAAKARGERLELMTHDRYRAEVADRMRADCHHSPVTRMPLPAGGWDEETGYPDAEADG